MVSAVCVVSVLLVCTSSIAKCCTSFFLTEANNYVWLLQALGRSKEEYVLEAQSKTKNAQKAALAAAFNYFRSQLETDQSTWDAVQMRLADRN